MYDGPRYTKPAHQFGELPGDLGEMLDGGSDDDENWVGEGFTVRSDERPDE